MWLKKKAVEDIKMEDQSFPYDQWVAEALTGVLRRAIQQLADHGFEGDHHFYINFETNHPDVRIPGFLRAQYPEEITIVLQHQFDGLHVHDDGFEVTLSFSGQKHSLYAPYAAVTSFADPSVNFGLQMGLRDNDNENEIGKLTAATDIAAAPEAEPAVKPKPAPEPETLPAEGGDKADAEAAEDSSEPQTAEVITLDAFRKK